MTNDDEIKMKVLQNMMLVSMSNMLAAMAAGHDVDHHAINMLETGKMLAEMNIILKTEAGL